MASEPGDRRSVSVPLPADLREWLTEQAGRLDVDEETVVRQLLASYRTTEQLDGDLDVGDVLEGGDDAVEELVRRTIRDRLDDIAAAVDDRRDVDAGAVETELRGEIERVEGDFQSKLDDVRQRVIQVKRETDGKAERDHDHEDLDRALDRLDDVEDALADLGDVVDDVEGTQSESVRRLDDFDDRLDDVEEKLRTVAWVVSDLRDAHESQQGTTETVERLKRGAAQSDIERAKCENCGEGVTISLLTEPTCPHCDATVTEVEPAQGFFSKPKLAVAKQLEAGTENEPERNVPDAAERRR
jgi:uncharacterized protein YoxC